MTKILIFGLPRTATTVFQQQLSNIFSVANLNEPYNGDNISSNNVQNWYSWTEKQKNCVIKLLSTNLHQSNNINVSLGKLFKQGKFTHLAVTQRKNLSDCCASLFYADRILKKYHFEEQDSIRRVRFEIDNEFLNSWLVDVKLYYQALADLRSNNVSYEIFDYDLYAQGIPQTIFNHQIATGKDTNFVRKEIKYQRLCVNYQEITTTIDNYVKRIQH